MPSKSELARELMLDKKDLGITVTKEGKVIDGWAPKLRDELAKRYPSFNFSLMDIHGAAKTLKFCDERTRLLKLSFEFEQYRRCPQFEELWCDMAMDFMRYILPMEIDLVNRPSRGLIFGTQTVFSHTKTSRLCLDNAFVVHEFLKLVEAANMVVGNIKAPAKALRKRKDWRALNDPKKKLQKVETGPVDPPALARRADGFYRKYSPKEMNRLVLMMDSCSTSEYMETFIDVTTKYPNMYIIKMYRKGTGPFAILRAFRGDVSVISNEGMKFLISELRKGKWTLLMEPQRVFKFLDINYQGGDNGGFDLL